MGDSVSIQQLRKRDRAIVQLLQEAVKDDLDAEVTLGLIKYSKYSDSEYEVDFYDEDVKINALISSNGEKFEVEMSLPLTGEYFT